MTIFACNGRDYCVAQRPQLTTSETDRWDFVGHNGSYPEGFVLPWLQSNLQNKTGIDISDVISCWVITMIIVWLLRLVLQNWNGVYPPWFIHVYFAQYVLSLIARFMGPTWGPTGIDRTQVGPMLAQWTLLSGMCHMFSWIQLKLIRQTSNEPFFLFRCIFADIFRNFFVHQTHFNGLQ